MRDRPALSHRAPGRQQWYTVDVVVVTPYLGKLGVLCVEAPGRRGRRTREIPWAVPQAHEALDAVARRITRAVAGLDALWMEQVGAFAGTANHPSGASLSVCFVSVTPSGTSHEIARSAGWRHCEDLPGLGARQDAMVRAALNALRQRMDYEPIPFRLLPARFTLSDLQQVYELLLGRPVHKASFRRALHAAWLVEPTDEWRSEGRGRPAQLFRYAPRRRRRRPRGVRFDLL
jgi:hypothetical protein